MQGARADARLLDLAEEPLAQVRVRSVAVVRQLVEQGPHLADTLATLLAREPPARDLGEGPMRHRHDPSPLTAGGTRGHPDHGSSPRVRPPLPPTLVLEGAAQPFLLEMVERQAMSGSPAMRLRHVKGSLHRPVVPAPVPAPTRPWHGSRPARSAILRACPPSLSRKVPLAELHCHLGAAVTPSIMWSIAHAQGIKLPTRDYWDFRDLITVHPRRPKSFDGYLQLFHWTELIQSSPIAVERAVYEVIGGAYRKNNVTTTELRFNPMKRNRGGEQDLDHIIAAAVRGMDRATLEYPVKPGLIFCLDRAFPYELNEIIAEKAIAWRDRGVVGVDIAGPESATFRVADYRRALPAGAPARPRDHRPHRRVRARSRRSRGSSSCWSRTASATASRRPTTRARWRCSASGGSCWRSAPPRT